MNLAVKFHKDKKKPLGMPGEWPAEVIELGSSSSYHDKSWAIMSKEAYEAYRISKSFLHENYKKKYLDKNMQPHKGLKSVWIKIKHYLGLL